MRFFDISSPVTGLNHHMMRITRVLRLVFLSLFMFLLGGCAHPYVLKMQNGTRVTSISKPKLDHGYYVFKDNQGRERRVPAGRVREMEPASMAEEEKPQFSIS